MASGTSTPLGPLSGFLTVLGNREGVTVGTVPTAPLSTTGGSSTTNSSTTTGSSTTTAPAAIPVIASKTAPKLAKVKIISHKVKGHVLTLVVKVPAAGKLTVTAAHAKRQSKKLAKAMTVTVRVPLTKAGIASVKRHHRMKDKVKVAFKAALGPASSASTTVRFR